MAITYPSFVLPNQRRPQTYAVLRSLVSIVQIDQNNNPLTNSILLGANEVDGQVVINFPCMPDTIELTRKANYANNSKNPITPDGFHLYQGTDPMVIPLSFKLSAFDDYCDPRHGPLVLLAMAAKLHALCLPIKRASSTQAVAASVSAVPTIGASEAALKDTSGATATPATATENYAAPPACNLDIMMASVGGGRGQTTASNNGVSMGINCTGFITDARVVFSGPWLQGSFSDAGMRNLPTMAEFSFNFVHQPGYTNKVGKATNPNIATSARDIYNRLYNTNDLGRTSGFVSLNDFDPSSQAEGEVVGTTRLSI